MKPSGNNPAGRDRIKGLLAWWGTSHLANASGMEAQARQLQVLLVDLNELLTEASSSQAQVSSAADEHLNRALRQLVSARQPSDLMATRSNLVTGLKESFAAQAKTWAELTRKLDDCCLAAARKADAEAHERGGGSVPIRPRVADRPVREASGLRAAWSQLEALSWKP